PIRCARTSSAACGRSPRRSGSRSMREVRTDAHLHLWDLAGGGYGWLAEAPEALRRNARWDAAAPQLDALGVERVVLVQADDTRADTLAMQEAATAIES